MSELNMRPGIRFGGYPQKQDNTDSDLAQALYQGYLRYKHRLGKRIYSQGYVVREINRYQLSLEKCSEQELTRSILQLRAQLQRKGLQKPQIFKAFAVIREVANRVLQKRHYDVQLYGGWIMMNGKLAEMATGEGKTLTFALPACTAALAGIPVHVITANDYLASRDAELMTPLYKRLGLSGSAVVDSMDFAQCQKNYRCDIVHTTNKKVAFDYLRDRIAMGTDTGPLRFQYRQIERRQHPRGGSQLLLTGLCFALVDEADSVLIDEAKTPLVITRTLPSEVTPETYADALYLASTLFVERDYEVDEKSRSIELTPAGEDNLGELISNLPKLWRNKPRREMLVKQALAANCFYHRDHQYLVTDGRIQIIDEASGRVMADRSWEQGLHQMIEAKEGCTISDPRESQARISYQRFFSRYLRIGGASGTLAEVKQELHKVYGLDVVKVATHRQSKRSFWGERVFRTEVAKKQALLERVTRLHAEGRPILIGTCSVAESEQVSGWLQQGKIKHRVLNARQDEHEAAIIAHAGQLGAVTVATNMAGRGTDIALASGVPELGGLHVIALGRNTSHRVDRQLYGRCARQGDPGSAEAILSLQDPFLANFYSSAMLKVLDNLAVAKNRLPLLISSLVTGRPQQRFERQQARARQRLMKQDRQLRRILAFAGKFE